MSGNFIVIEGLDGSGKATQTELLYESIKKSGEEIKKISFPNYSDPSSSLVKMYLRGDFGKNSSDTNCYAASSFYSVDRYASYQKYWKEDYKQGKIILSDRYTTANMVHQTSKLPKESWDSFTNWIYDFEFEKLLLPIPNLVIYLDMSPNVSKKLILKRYDGDKTKEDIHEADFEYLLQCREAAMYSAEKYGWVVVKCDDGENPYSIEEIHNKVKQATNKILDIFK